MQIGIDRLKKKKKNRGHKVERVGRGGWIREERRSKYDQNTLCTMLKN